MRIPDYIATAQTNLMRTKARTVLTVLAFVIGTFTLSMTTAFTEGLRSYINTQIGAYGQPNLVQVGLASNNTTQTSPSGVTYYNASQQSSGTEGGGKHGTHVVYVLTSKDLAKVQAVPNVKAAYLDYTNLNIDYIQYGNQPKYILPASSAYPGLSTSLAAGSFPSASQTNGIVLPYPYVEALGAQNASDLIGKTATLHVTNPTSGQGKDYTVVITGILPDTAHTPGAMLAYQTLDDMAQFQTGGTPQYTGIVAITNNNPNKAMRSGIENKLTSEGYQVQDYDDLLNGFKAPLQTVTYGLDGFAGIALLAATIGIVNTLLMSVLERTQEIGLLKALGMRRRGITGIYLAEAASIGFWGGVIGVVFAELLGLVANPLLSKSVFKGIGNAHILSYPLQYMAAIVGGAMIIGLLAGTLPAIRAGRLDPIDALRRE
jgi:putative ABC transport system permease protein